MAKKKTNNKKKAAAEEAAEAAEPEASEEEELEVVDDSGNADDDGPSIIDTPVGPILRTSDGDLPTTKGDAADDDSADDDAADDDAADDCGHDHEHGDHGHAHGDHGHAHGDHGHGYEVTGVEPDAPKTVNLAAIVSILCILIFVASWGMVSFYKLRSAHIEDQQNALIRENSHGDMVPAGDVADRLLIAERNNALLQIDEPVALDDESGLYRVGIDRARAILLARPDLLGPMTGADEAVQP